MHLKLLKRGKRHEELAKGPCWLMLQQGLPQQLRLHNLAIANVRLNCPLYQLRTGINQHPLVLPVGTMMFIFQQFQKLVQWCQLSTLMVYSQVNTFESPCDASQISCEIDVTPSTTPLNDNDPFSNAPAAPANSNSPPSTYIHKIYWLLYSRASTWDTKFSTQCWIIPCTKSVFFTVQ